MAKPDDLEAVRTIATALSGFSPEEQERVLRWAREKIGLAHLPRLAPETRPHQTPSVSGQIQPLPASPSAPSGKDLKTFVNEKSPKSDVQFAATVAYFHRFDAPPETRKNEIDATTLQDACRLAGRARLKFPLMTLNNAKKLGLLDSGGEKGKFVLNTVGENLVAMTLPGPVAGALKDRNPRKPKKSRGKRLNRK